jgi:hypothetical protein
VLLNCEFDHWERVNPQEKIGEKRNKGCNEKEKEKKDLLL